MQKINENDTTDSDGKPAAYITIQQSGAYRVKGVLGELQRGSLKEGDRVKLEPRTEENAAWTGTVTLVDYENPTQGSDTPYVVVEDRIEAIHWAMDHAQPGDVIVLCGKGHETYQEVNHVKHHMDEREIVADYLNAGK